MLQSFLKEHFEESLNVQDNFFQSSLFSLLFWKSSEYISCFISCEIEELFERINFTYSSNLVRNPGNLLGPKISKEMIPINKISKNIYSLIKDESIFKKIKDN